MRQGPEKLHIRWWHPLAALVLTAVILLARTPAFVQTGSVTDGPILIIDAGHGGADGGAVAPDGTLESDVNLDVALRMEAIAAFWGVPTVMTRATAEIDYPQEATTLSAMKKADQNARVALIGSVPDGILVSIHQNNYPAASPHGIQVFYGTAQGSDILAGLMQENLTAQLCPNNRRLAERIDENVYLMRKAACPAVLVECGFLSNPDELEKLKTENYRMKLAVAMLASYLQYTADNMA